MSKLIVEMEIPKSCPCDLIGIGYAMCCSAANSKKRIVEYDECVKSGTKPDWCPIKGVLPEEHGRLGDLDRLAEMVNGLRIDAMQKGSDTNPYWVLGDIIAQAKTIVAAERKDDADN